MRIAYFTHQFPGVRMGGLGSYTVAAARALAAQGHDVHIFTFSVREDVRRQFAEDSIAPVVLHDVADLATRVANGRISAELAAAASAGGDAVYRLAMGAMLGEALIAEHVIRPFDVVEAPEYEALTLPLMLSLRQAGTSVPPLAVVTQLHSGAAISRRGNSQIDTPADITIDALETAAILLADGVVAMTQAVVRETQRALGVDRDVALVPLAVPLEPDYVPPPSDGPVLFVGRLERLKGVDVLTRAAAQFLAMCPNARIRFGGPDTPTAPAADGETKSMRAWMLKQIPERLHGRVEFTGELAPREVTAQMRAARFLALPSVVENFSLVAAQALGMGRTAVFSSGIGTTEVYGDTGVMFPNADADQLAAALASLWNDSARIDALSLAAWKRAGSEFNQEKITAKQIAFYNNVIAAAKQRKRDLPEIPPRFATALLDPLVAMTRFACGIRDAQAALTPGHRLLRIMQQIGADARNPTARVLLYGAGRYSARLMTEKQLWAAAGHEVVGFIDDGKRSAQETHYLGLPVETRDAVMQRLLASEQIPPIVLSTDTFQHQFWEQTRELREHGVKVYKLY